MPPVRLRQSKLSNKQVQRQRTSPARGRGRRRTVQPDEAATSSDTVNVSASIMPTQMIEESQQPTQQAGESFNIPSIIEESDFNLFDISDYQPVQTVTTFDSLGGHIPLKLKQKIWEGKFIDLALLLKSAIELDNEIESKGELQIRDGKMCLVKQKTNSFLSIEKWTTAFIIFSSIMLEKYRTRTQEMLKYMRDIRIAASKSSGWYKYDEQFRLRKASDPHSSWGQINTELWLLFVNNNKTPFNPDQPHNAYNPTIKHQPRLNTPSNNYYCNLYNSGKQCRFYPNCRFKHSCKLCGGTHAAINCRKQQSKY